jgi:hypothetical protein
MFLIQSEKELLNAFRPRDRNAFEPPPGRTYPVFVRDYLSWVDPSGAHVYLIIQDPSSKRPLGIAFRRNPGSAAGAQLCDWCHTHGSSQDINLLTTDRNSKRRVGVLLCTDLRCGEKIEQHANLSGRSPIEPRQRMLERMMRFARECLGIESVPAA